MKLEQQIDKNAQSALKDLASVEKAANEWGTVAISDLVLVKNNHQFDLGYTNSTRDYINLARSNRSGRATSTDIAKLMLQLNGQAALASPISTGRPATGTNAASGLLDQEQRPSLRDSLTNASTGTAPGAKIEAGLALPERQALEQGVNDKLVELMLNLLVNPPDIKDKAILFGVMQVTCQPGWRTKEGYIADLNVSVRYARKVTKTKSKSKSNMTTGNGTFFNGNPPTNEKPNSDDVWDINPAASPGVYAVLPLIDTETFDLASLRQRQLDLAATLAAAFAAQGMTAQAELLARYVRDRTFQVQTVSQLPSYSSYSDGLSFGFRLYPTPRAIGDVDQPFSGPKAILNPTTFPAVVAILVDKSEQESHPASRSDDCQQGGKDAQCKSGTWDHYFVQTHIRWLPNKQPIRAFYRAFGSLSPHQPPGDFDLADQGELAQKLDRAYGKIEWSAIVGKPSATLELARGTYSSLRESLFGMTRIHAFPEQLFDAGKCPEPKSTARLVAFGPKDLRNKSGKSVVFLIQGTGFPSNEVATPLAIAIAGQVRNGDAIASVAKDEAGSFVWQATIDWPDALFGETDVPVSVATQKAGIVSETFKVKFPEKTANEDKPAQKPSGLTITNPVNLKLSTETPVQLELRPADNGKADASP